MHSSRQNSIGKPKTVNIESETVIGTALDPTKLSTPTMSEFVSSTSRRPKVVMKKVWSKNSNFISTLSSHNSQKVSPRTMREQVLGESKLNSEIDNL